jgi:hypothetical protein
VPSRQAALLNMPSSLPALPDTLQWQPTQKKVCVGLNPQQQLAQMAMPFGLNGNVSTNVGGLAGGYRSSRGSRFSCPRSSPRSSLRRP